MNIDEELRKLKIKRTSKCYVGKQMGNQVWFHRSYAHKILSKSQMKNLNELESLIPCDVVRVDLVTGVLLIVECPTFDLLPEPVICRTISSKNPSVIKKSSTNPLIYHSKWLFVSDDYQGFSVEESKLRSIAWKMLIGVDRSISSKIGRKSFWDNWLNEQCLDKNELISK